MLAIIVSWICCCFVLVTLGDMVLLLYEKLTGKTEKLNLLDALLVGMCLAVALLSVLSFWLPIDFRVFMASAVVSSLFWIVNVRHMRKRLTSVKLCLQQYSLLELCPYIFLSVFFILAPVWSFGVKLDPFIYHHANIMWNESYPIIPGLANLDEKFGFNSNYFLLLAMFSLRPLFGELIIGLQSLLAFLIAAYIYSEILKIRFDIKRVVLFFIYIVFIFFNQNEMSETSTDIVPSLIIFYLISKIILYPDSLKKNLLFFGVVPVALITLKLSTSLFLIICLVPVYYKVFREKAYKSLVFVLLFSLTIGLFWLLRNVVISGYLIFPLYEIDLFSFDWKIPASIVKTQKDFIHSYSVDKVLATINAFDVGNYYFYSTVVVLILCCLSLLYSVVFLLKNRKKLDFVYIFIFVVLLLNFLFWALSAPDVRFGYGLIFGIVFLAFFLFFSKKTDAVFARKLIEIKSYSISLGLSILFVFSLVWGYYGYRWASKYRTYLVQNYEVKPCDAWMEMLTVPMRLSYQKDRELTRENERFGVNDEYRLEPYEIGDSLTIYVSSSRLGFVFDCVPAVSDCEVNPQLLFHDYRLIEARGDSFKDGFRYKYTR